jgi:hypothetical protein
MSNPSEPTASDPSLASSALFAALDEYFEWLQEREDSEDQMANIQARNAVADCSSQLGLILIEHGIYTANTQTEGPSPSE